MWKGFKMNISLTKNEVILLKLLISEGIKQDNLRVALKKINTKLNKGLKGVL